MLKIVRRPLAKRDIQGIWLYTCEKWGQDQAQRYLAELDYGIKALGHSPLIGKSCDFIRTGYYTFPVNRHVVYYRVEESTIHIVRVLHERMDATLHL